MGDEADRQIQEGMDADGAFGPPLARGRPKAGLRSDGRVWVTAEGKAIPLAKMADRHLENIIRAVAQRIEWGKSQHTIGAFSNEQILAFLQGEQLRRRSLEAEVQTAERVIRSKREDGRARKALASTVEETERELDALMDLD